MPAQKSSSGGGRAKSGTKQASNAPRTRTQANAAGTENLTNIADQLINRVIKPLDLVLLTRERIQETLDEAAERGRVTRSDANELVGELVRRGRQQREDILGDLENLLGRGRDQLESATRRARLSDPVDKIVRSAERARRTVVVGPSLPILGYDELTAAQVGQRLTGLTPAELRKVREYERRHANRKSVLAAIEKALA
jgi:polyhydroxyalkanoate synthesis regulator phasin